MSEKKNSSIHYLLSGLFGALLGMAAIYLLKKSGELEEEENFFTKQNLSKIGLGTISFLYSMLGKGRGKHK